MLGLANKGLLIGKFDSIKQIQYDLKSTKSSHNLFSIPKAKFGSIAIKNPTAFTMDGPLFARPNLCS